EPAPCGVADELRQEQRQRRCCATPPRLSPDQPSGYTYEHIESRPHRAKEPARWRPRRPDKTYVELSRMARGERADSPGCQGHQQPTDQANHDPIRAISLGKSVSVESWCRL